MPQPQDRATAPTSGRIEAEPPAVSGPTEAAELAARFANLMEELLLLVEEETKLVRAGRPREATALDQRKSDLARRYLADATRLKNCRDYLREHAPDLLRDLQERHEVFRALLQINLTVLATAHAVAESLVRGVSGELARKSSPQTYTPYGRNAAPAGSAPPIAVSRHL